VRWGLETSFRPLERVSMPCVYFKSVRSSCGDTEALVSACTVVVIVCEGWGACSSHYM
jgi:hypothetical protein